MFRFLWFVSLLAFSLGKCPSNSISRNEDPSICYSFHPSYSNFQDALTICESFGAELVTLKNNYINTFVSKIARRVFKKSLETNYFWSGGHRHVNKNVFVSINGAKFEYEKFIINLKRKNSASCVSVKFEQGFWRAEDCWKKLPFVCEFFAKQNVTPINAINFDENKNNKGTSPDNVKPATNEPVKTTTKSTTLNPTTKISSSTTTHTFNSNNYSCHKGWTLFNETKSCYKMKHPKSWKDAEASCQRDKAHLASIHSEAENHFILELNNKFGEACVPGSQKSAQDQIWIGFSQDNQGVNFNGQKYKWSDSSADDFKNWVNFDNYQGNEHCGAMLACFTNGKWNDYICSEKNKYICKKPAVKL